MSRRVAGTMGCVARHRGLQKFFHFGPEETIAVRAIERTGDLALVRKEIHAAGLSWSDEDLAEFLQLLIRSQLVVPSDESTPGQSPTSTTEPKRGAPDASPADQAGPPPSAGRSSASSLVLRSMSSFISLRIPLFHFDRPASWLSDRVGWAFRFPAVVFWTLLVASGVSIVGLRSAEFGDELQRLFDQRMFIPLAVIWIVVKVLHEAGHAVAAKRQGVRVGQTGVMFFLLAPLAYVDVTDAWRLSRPFARIQIALAGIYVELAIAATAAWCWLASGFLSSQPSLLGHLAAQIFLVAGPGTLLVNANPLLRLDGYYVLSDLLDIPNLRSHGRRMLLSAIEFVLLGRPIERPTLQGWRVTAAVSHAIASVVFQVVWMTGLIIAVTSWAKGLGVALAIVAFLLWAALPLGRWLWRHIRAADTWRSRRRLAFAVLMIASVAQWILSSPSPIARRIPVVAMHHEEQIARAPVDAFVDQVWVETGQRVQRGDLLMELSDENSWLQLNLLRADLSIAELNTVQFRQGGELADARAAQQTADSLRRRIDELQAARAELSVTAERSGVVTTADPQQWLGRFAEQGTELIRVARPGQKELVISLDDQSLEDYESANSDERFVVRFRGGQRVEVGVGSIRPRASDALPHPALAASAGGPLPVEPDSEGDVRLIAPRLNAVCQLNPAVAMQVQDGQVGTLRIGDTRSIGSRLWQWVRSGEAISRNGKSN